MTARSFMWHLILAALILASLVLIPAISLAGFAGSSSCSSCHTAQHNAWSGSHHELAMQHASDQTMLGDFDGSEFEIHGVTSRFYQKEGKYFVNTDGPDGNLQDFEIKYTFGVTPLQQYLIEFPDGRVQALSIAWDSRPQATGGQRWFHLYPDEFIGHDDVLHWTGSQQNWNYMCADCHTTNFKKEYKASSNSFKSSWSEMDVGCEACHGPGDAHIEWAKQDDSPVELDINKGLNFLLNERQSVTWPIDQATGTAQRSKENTARVEMEVCATCHSRRGIIREGAVEHPEFLNHYQPALLTQDLYHADGQILDEVYVWGSFQQSKMFAAGVTCSDCHDPHSLELRAPGDAVCAQCHIPEKFAVPEHHHHEVGSVGANCLNCHMPETTYMVVDPRRDHSIRIPRPDLSLELGTPNACSQCHENETTQWAADQFADWYPDAIKPFQNWGGVFTLARAGTVDAGPSLAKLVLDPNTPDIVKATAIFELRHYLNAETVPALQAALSDDSALVRMAAVRATDPIPVESRLPFVGPLMQDDLLAVRTEAARGLAGVSRGQMNPAGGNLLDQAVAEYIKTQELNADRAEAHLNLGNLYTELNEPAKAEREYRSAIKLEPNFAPSYINLSDLYRTQDMGAQAISVLKDGITKQPAVAALHHSLGLALVRQDDTATALTALQRSVELAPEAARYAYVYGVALNSTGKPEQSISVLDQAHGVHPNDPEILFALATINRDLGRKDAARIWANKLSVLLPGNEAVQQLLQSLD